MVSKTNNSSPTEEEVAVAGEVTAVASSRDSPEMMTISRKSETPFSSASSAASTEAATEAKEVTSEVMASLEEEVSIAETAVASTLTSRKVSTRERRRSAPSPLSTSHRKLPKKRMNENNSTSQFSAGTSQ